VILLITLVILVILSTLGYTLCVRLAARRHRDQYIIDYCQAKHACASGLKYALSSLGELQIQLISRPNEPDFSDVFALSEQQYQKLLALVDANQIGDSNTVEAGREKGVKSRKDKKRLQSEKATKTRDNLGAWDINDSNDGYDPNHGTLWPQKRLTIPGPYGPPWPLVAEPIELEIGTAKVKIEIEDENAKYPLGWAMLTDEKTLAQAAVGWVTFCEWMGYAADEIDQLKADLVKIGKLKPFKTEFKTQTQAFTPAAGVRGRISRPTTGTGTATRRPPPGTRPVPPAVQIEQQSKEFAQLFHSSLVNTDLLARPSIESDTRKESALKYLSLWATRHVNINTAPRQVLEATLVFGSVADGPKIADAIIRQRRIQPLADVNELKQVAFQYATAVDKCKDFITTTSTVFTVRVTAVSGVATATAVAAVSKEADKIKRMAVVSD
jgi:hypothetical protein